ncbi:transporter substrate-binding domain-containing protein [Paucibacter sp. AS339]|uniref:substrate-binding periplasmic protein n=1 Tax=Paucibacter hankyongi TaxID=3133434 RepID=UPI0030B24FA5
MTTCLIQSLAGSTGPSRRAALVWGVAAALALREASAQPLVNEPGKLTVLMEELPPYSHQDGAGRPSGYAYELALALLSRAKIEATFEFASWPRILHRAHNEANILVPAMVRLAEREAQFFWPAQISVRRGTLYRLKSRPELRPRNIAEVSAYRVAVVKSDVSERELLALGLNQQQHLDRSADHASQLRRFFAGRADLLALNPSLAPALLRQFGHDPDLIEPVLKFSESRPSMALSLASGEPMLLRLQQAWAEMRQDGSWAAILKRYPMMTQE